MKTYSFDDSHIGLSDEGNNHLISRMIPRPTGLTNAGWYSHAAKVCGVLNELHRQSQEPTHES